MPATVGGGGGGGCDPFGDPTCDPFCDPSDPDCNPPSCDPEWGPCWPPGGGGGGGGASPAPPATPSPGVPSGIPGNAGFPSLGVPSIMCAIMPGLCTNNNPESGAPYPWWFFPPIGVVVYAQATASPQPQTTESQGAQPKAGSWNISHPSPEVCGRVKTVLIGTAALGGLSELVSMAFPPAAVAAEPVAAAAGINFVLFGTYYVAFCGSW
jgi:hypothetical protein